MIFHCYQSLILRPKLTGRQLFYSDKNMCILVQVSLKFVSMTIDYHIFKNTAIPTLWRHLIMARNSSDVKEKQLKKETTAVSQCFPIILPKRHEGDTSQHHDDVIKWKHFPRYWPLVQGIHRSPVNSLHKGQWRGALRLSLIFVWINGWENNREAGDLRRYRAHYYVIVMMFP